MSEQNEFGRVSVEELEKAFETTSRRKRKNENRFKGRSRIVKEQSV